MIITIFCVIVRKKKYYEVFINQGGICCTAFNLCKYKCKNEIIQ